VFIKGRRNSIILVKVLLILIYYYKQQRCANTYEEKERVSKTNTISQHITCMR